MIALPLLVAIALGFEKYLIEPLMRRFEQIQEYLFLLVIGWCPGGRWERAWRKDYLGEIGAFIAGIALASCPVSIFIADSLRSPRDFFPVLFFFPPRRRFPKR